MANITQKVKCQWTEDCFHFATSTRIFNNLFLTSHIFHRYMYTCTETRTTSTVHASQGNTSLYNSSTSADSNLKRKVNKWCLTLQNKSEDGKFRFELNEQDLWQVSWWQMSRTETNRSLAARAWFPSVTFHNEGEERALVNTHNIMEAVKMVLLTHSVGFGFTKDFCPFWCIWAL